MDKIKREDEMVTWEELEGALEAIRNNLNVLKEAEETGDFSLHEAEIYIAYLDGHENCCPLRASRGELTQQERIHLRAARVIGGIHKQKQKFWSKSEVIKAIKESDQ